MLPTTIKAAIYTRVSRDDTGEGKSNERQRAELETLAKLRGWPVVAVHEDVSISAYSGKKRPGWQAVLEQVRSGEVNLILAWRMDRMIRSTRELEGLLELVEANGANIATLEGDLDLTNEGGRAVARILGAIAQMEVERKGARQKAANRQRAAAGEVWASGFRAFGYEQDGTVRESEAELIRQAVRDVLGGASIRSVVRQWTELGLSSPRNAKAGWTHRSVRAILLNPRNAGLVRYKGEVIGRGKWQALISESDFTELVALLTAPDRLTRKGASRGRAAENLLTGIAVCGTCGETVNAASGYKGAPVYQCKGYHVSTPRAEADHFVSHHLIGAIVTTEPGAVLATVDGSKPGELAAEVERLRERQAELARSFAHGSITVSQLEDATAVLSRQLEELEERMSDAVEDAADARVASMVTALTWGESTLEQQRAALRRVATVTLHPRGRGRRDVPIEDQVFVSVRAADGRVFESDGWLHVRHPAPASAEPVEATA